MIEIIFLFRFSILSFLAVQSLYCWDILLTKVHSYIHTCTCIMYIYIIIISKKMSEILVAILNDHATKYVRVLTGMVIWKDISQGFACANALSLPLSSPSHSRSLDRIHSLSFTFSLRLRVYSNALASVYLVRKLIRDLGLNAESIILLSCVNLVLNFFTWNIK